MNKRWKSFAARVDGLNLRERVFLFLAVIVVLVALVDAAWVSPARAAHQIVRQRFDANQAELQRLREENRLLALQPNPSRQLREELAHVQTQVGDLENSISAVSVAFKGSTSLPEVLGHFLRRQPTLTLVRTGNLQAEASGASGAPVAPRVGGLTRQGLELTVAGPYADLVRFVQSLETAMPDLRWGSFKLRAEQQPAELTLQVFLVGVQQ